MAKNPPRHDENPKKRLLAIGTDHPAQNSDLLVQRARDIQGKGEQLWFGIKASGYEPYRWCLLSWEDLEELTLVLLNELARREEERDG